MCKVVFIKLGIYQFGGPQNVLYTCWCHNQLRLKLFIFEFMKFKMNKVLHERETIGNVTLFVAAAKILPVKMRTSIDLAQLPCLPTCLVCACY